MHKLGGFQWKRVVGGAGACLVAAGALAACGSPAAKPTGTPKAQLQSSVSTLGSSPTLSMDFHLTATASQLHAVAPSIPTPYDSVLTGASIVVSETTTDGKSLDSVGKAAGAAGSISAALDSLRQLDAEVAVNGGGNELVDLRFVNGTLYAKANVSDLLGLFGESQSALSSAAAKLPKSSQYNFARAALAGKWVSLNLITAVQGYLSTAPTETPAQAKSMVTTLMKDFAALYTSDVTVTSAGSGAGGTTKLAVSANERTIVEGLVSAFMQLDPTASTGSASADLSKVPNQTVTGQATLNGTALTGIQINLSQLIPGVSPTAKPLEMVATISHPAVSVSTPTGATTASIAALGKLFSALGGASSATGSGTAGSTT